MSKDKMESLRRDFGNYFDAIEDVDKWCRDVRGKDQPGVVPVQSFMVRCAFRYALGRMTYIVGDVCEEISRCIGLIETRDLKLMRTEIEEAHSRGGLGMDCDQAEWMRLRLEIEEELKRRGHKCGKIVDLIPLLVSSASRNAAKLERS